MSNTKSLKARALEWLSRREMSQAQLRQKLLPYAENPDEVDDILRDFAGRNWQSDQRFAESFIHHKSRKNGALRLQMELKQKGVDNEIIRNLLPDKETELQNAIEVLEKKFKAPASDMKEKQKQMRFMLYRGFDMDTVQKAMRNAWQDQDDEWD